ncbi:MAG: hypothetical protein JW854_17395 [Actinobacteria bacterium]|nr:hypothetical protein [Actinomycetota bacterium]
MQQVWDFDQPGDYTFERELITVNEGDDSAAALKELPADAFWNVTYEVPLPEQAPEYHQMAFDADGNIVAIGSNTDMPVRPITGQLLVAKYDRSGQLLPGWPKFHTDPVYRWNEGEDVALDEEGNMAIAGYSIVNGRSWVFSMWMLAPDGTILPGWPQYVASDHAYGTGVIVDSNGDILACGACGPTGHDQILLAKYRSDGTPVEGWPKAYNPVAGQGAFSYDIIQDADGDLMVVGYAGSASGGRDAVLYKLDLDGNVLPGWPKIWDSAPGTYDEYFALSQDKNGDYCIVGTGQGADEGSGKLLVTRYSVDGEQRAGWPQVYDREGVRNYSPPDAWRGMVDGLGNIACAFIAQAPAPEVLTLEYEADGSLAGGFPKTVSREGFLVGTRSCTVDEFNNIYTAGFSHLAGDEDIDHTTFLAKYPPAPFSTGMPTVTTKTGLAYTKLMGFREALWEGSEGSTAYQLSPDGEEWYFHDGSGWIKATPREETNTAAEVDENIAGFDSEAGSGTLYIRVFLVSGGSEKVQLDSISVEYE